MGEETEPSGIYKEETERGPQVLTDLFFHLMNIFWKKALHLPETL